ncbi:MAG: DNA-processing protein DprA [Bacteroidetes bacterium]|nr:DNA-processing protein DprA [Bacteroidota bacterium]MCL2302800.1 DNA-processing protein DprA [Lentimicrobiaceae bacterium]
MLDELFYKIALSYQKGYGNSIIKKLLQLSGSASALFHDFHSIRKKHQTTRSFPAPPVLTSEIEKAVHSELNVAAKNNIFHCFYTDHDYPKRLLRCNDAPYMFCYQGSNQFNFEKTLAIVGTRHATSYGKDTVRRVLSGLSSHNISIISGLAMGIDTFAHEAALDYSLHTVGIMGSGFGNIYPSSNKKLAKRMTDLGSTLVSEFSYYTLPDRQNFPKRNRIIAGMADALLVVETGKRGGSIITACIAHSYQRDVFAIPGSVFEPSREGCHELIRQNLAALVTSGEDIIDMMGWNAEKPAQIQPQLFQQLNANEEIVVSIIQNLKEVHIDELITQNCTLTPSKMASVLLGLELNGVIEALPGKRYRLIK